MNNIELSSKLTNLSMISIFWLRDFAIEEIFFLFLHFLYKEYFFLS